MIKRTLAPKAAIASSSTAPREPLAGATRGFDSFPLFSGDNIADVAIENIAIDGNRENNENLDGNYAGCIFLQDCNRVTSRVTARNNNGDGLSWQICHDVVVENATVTITPAGLHPGSGRSGRSCATTKSSATTSASFSAGA